MKNKKYVVAGSWFYRPGPKGVSLLEYHEEDGSLTLLKTKMREINADAMCLNREKKLAYFADACATPRGGHVVTVRLDTELEDLEMVSRKDTLFRDPNYIWMEQGAAKYAFVTHHSNTVLVNKLIRGEAGDFDVEAVYDDVGLVVFRMDEWGSLGEICDVALTSVQGEGQHLYSRQHSVVGDPSGKILIVCDKGLDRLYVFSFDKEKEKLIRRSEYRLLESTAPRYGIFHPQLPVYYCSCEKRLAVLAFRYDGEKGMLEPFGEVSLTDGENLRGNRPEKQIECGDIKMNTDKNCIYVTIRGLDQIAVLRIREDGALERIQNVSSGGESPRCLCISPDGRFLLCGNLLSQSIRTLKILEDGTLELTESECSVPLPSCMEIL